MNGKKPYHPQNPVRVEELELLLTTLAQKIFASLPPATRRQQSAREIARHTINAVYQR